MKTRVVIGVLCCLLGVVWFGQGIGVIGGSFMSGEAFWAVMGVVLLLIGGALLRGAIPRAPRDTPR